MLRRRTDAPVYDRSDYEGGSRVQRRFKDFSLGGQGPVATSKSDIA
jgi:hypothetical protein